MTMRIGIDLGGTKIEALALGPDDRVLAGPLRRPTPRNDYQATIDAIAGLVSDLGDLVGGGNVHSQTIGVAMPGSIAKRTGLVQNANSTWLNGRPFGHDLEARLGQPVRLANDANCFALSEAADGAAHGAASVFGVILGTGCGGGVVIAGRLLDGPLAIAGEWGHNPLPWPEAHEWPGPKCWCGRRGCLEAWISGPALEAQFGALTGNRASVSEITALAETGSDDARALLAIHTSRLARGLAHVINIFDPEVIVLGGGLSNCAHLYRDLPDAIRPHLFTDQPSVNLRPPRWGDSSGVRGAARLWPLAN